MRDRPVDETLHVQLVHIRMPHALLRGNHKRRNQKISIEAEKQRWLEIHINQSLKLWTIRHLVVDLVCHNRIVQNILQVCLPEGQNNIVHWRSDAPDYCMFLSLDFEQLVQELPVMRMEFTNVMENVLDKQSQLFTRDDRWVH